MDRSSNTLPDGDDTVVDVGETQTVGDIPSARRASQAGGATTGPSDSAAPVTSPAEAMRLEEIARTRMFIRAGWPLGIITIAALPLMRGDVLVRWFFAGTIVVAIGYGVVLDRMFRDPERFSHRKLVGIAVCLMAVGTTTVLYFGYFSPASALIVLGLYFLGRTEAGGFALFIYLLTVVIQVSLGVIIVTGVIEDPGLFPLGDTPLFEQIITIVLVQGVSLMAYLMAVWTRNRTVEGIEDLQRAVRKVAQRDALLIEARADLDRALQIGGPGRYTEQTLGSFKIGVVIGRGAMGEVYEAAHVDTGQVVAVKLLRPAGLSDPRAVARFLREVRAASALESPHVAHVIDASDPMDPVPYFVMERMRGIDLAQYLRKDKRRSMAALVELVSQVGSVTDAARAHGIVHRDLKPQNLFLADQPGGKPLWKVLDFGVSRLADQTGTLTQGHVVGTPSYMAPEQARGEDVDYRADLYALSAIAYRWLTGRPPFSGRDTPSLLYDVVFKMPQRPSDLADLSTDLDAFLAIGLAKQREDRFESGRQLAGALQAAAAGNLDEALRQRAAALVRRLPWGRTAAPAPDEI